MTTNIEKQKDSDDNSPKPIVPPIEPVEVSNQQDSNKSTKPRDWLQYGLDIAMVVVTTVLAIYTYKLFQAATIQSEAALISANAAKISANAAQRSVVVAESSISVSKSIAQTQERFATIEVRPYICFGGVFEHTFIVGKQMKAKFKVTNVGKTPAYALVSRSDIKTGTGVYPHERKLLTQPKSGGLVIGAGQTYVYEASGIIPFRLVDSVGVFGQHVTLFVHGKLWYRDYFGNPYFTNFCVFYRPRDKGFLQYAKWNDAD